MLTSTLEESGGCEIAGTDIIADAETRDLMKETKRFRKDPLAMSARFVPNFDV